MKSRTNWVKLLPKFKKEFVPGKRFTVQELVNWWESEGVPPISQLEYSNPKKYSYHISKCIFSFKKQLIKEGGTIATINAGTEYMVVAPEGSSHIYNKPKEKENNMPYKGTVATPIKKLHMAIAKIGKGKKNRKLKSVLTMIVDQLDSAKTPKKKGYKRYDSTKIDNIYDNVRSIIPIERKEFGAVLGDMYHTLAVRFDVDLSHIKKKYGYDKKMQAVEKLKLVDQLLEISKEKLENLR